MDISGPVREILQQSVAAVPAESIGDPLALFVQLVAVRDHPPVGVPAFVRGAAWQVGTVAGSNIAERPDPAEGPHPAEGVGLAAAVRLVPLVSRYHREATLAALRPRFELLVPAGEKLLVSRTTTAAEFLWQYWLLVLARERLRVAVPEMLMKGLWRRGWGGQSKEGFLHRRAAGQEEAATLNDLRALHAAYNALVLMRDLDKLEPLERLVRWHAGSMAGRPLMYEPWALAAFAALDDTGFVRQQLAAVQAHCAAGGRDIIMLALLADALITQEDVAGA